MHRRISLELSRPEKYRAQGIPLVALLLAVLAAGPACTRRTGSSERALAQAPVAAVSSECKHDAKALRCVKYLHNYDGDTVTFDVPGVHPLLGEKISVRVSGVDTPEVKTKDECEKASARIARNLVENKLKNAKRIDLVNVDRDKYFRILADVVADGTNVKDILMRNGLAYEYHGGTKQKVDWCKVARGEARRVPASKE